MKENKFRVYCEIEFEGKITKSMESPASWFLLTQTGKLWSYDPGETPQPLGKEYKKAIPLFYTGLKDKHGKEIYEGDILYYEFKQGWEIFFEDGCYYMMYDKHSYLFEKMRAMESEIIGNIYMNPELLNK